MKKFIAVLAIVALFGMATAEAGNLFFDVAEGVTETYSDDFNMGTGELFKTGLGTLIMTGDTIGREYHVHAGTMVLAGSGSFNTSSGVGLTISDATATFLVDAGATYNSANLGYQYVTLEAGTIGGSGTFHEVRGEYPNGPALTIGSGGTIAPGMPSEGPGTLTFDYPVTNGFKFAGDGTYDWELDDTGWDLLALTGNASLQITATSGDPFNINLHTSSTSWGPGEDHTWTIVTGSISGFDADAFVIDDTDFEGAGSTWSVELDGDDLNLVYEAPPVAEPAGLGLLGVALLAIRRRRS